MSHIVTIQTEVRDAIAVGAACHRLGLETPHVGTAQLFERPVRGLIVRLPEWRYPVVVDLPTGSLYFDNFFGEWGKPVHLDQFLQMYATEKAKLECRRQGHSVIEQILPDGSVKLTVQVGG